MPALINPRHERFCQELVKGASQGQAYTAAGYDAEGNVAEACASRLLTNVKIRDRVLELKNGAAARVEVTVASLVSELDGIRDLALKLEQPSAAVSAVMGKAKITGKIIERKEIGQPGEFELMDADQLRASISGDLEKLGLKDLAAEIIGRSREPGERLQ